MSWYTSIVVDEWIVWANVEILPSISWTPKSFKSIANRHGVLLHYEDLNDNNLTVMYQDHYFRSYIFSLLR